MATVSCVISYCENEDVFLENILKNCLIFSSDIVVSYGDLLFDGTPQDLSHLEDLKEAYPDVKFVEYKVDTSLKPSQMKGVQHREAAYWHNLSRWTGFQNLKHKNDNTTWVLFLDGDEIPEGQAMKLFLQQNSKTLQQFPDYIYKLANYWYFKHATYRAQTYEDSVLMVHVSNLNENNMFSDYERDDIIRLAPHVRQVKRMVTALDQRPMFHHFSWVRTYDKLLKKVKTWGHKNEYNASDIIEYIFHNNEVNDIIHQYQYDVVPDIFGIYI